MTDISIIKWVTSLGLVPITVAAVPILVIGLLMWPLITFAMGFQGIYEILVNPTKVGFSELIPTAVPFGCWGLFTLWQLALHFLKETRPPSNPKIKALGLFSGFVACIQLLVSDLTNTSQGPSWLSFMLLFSLAIGSFYLCLLIKSNKHQPTADASAISN